MKSTKFRFSSAAERAFVGALLAAGCAGATPPPLEHSGAEPPPERACVEEWVELPFTVSFVAGSAELDEGERTRLHEAMDPMRMVGRAGHVDVRRVRLGGHEDRCAGEGGAPALAELRARAALEALVEIEYPREVLDAVVLSPGAEPEPSCDDGPVGGVVELSLLVCR